MVMPRSTPRILGILALAGLMAAAAAAGLLLPRLASVGRPGEIGHGAESTPEAHAARIAAATKFAPDSASSEPGSRPGAAGALRFIPRSVDLALVIEDAASLRTSRFGAAAVRFLADASGMAAGRSAWSSLANRLGWSESETFDRLLGRRVVLVARLSPDNTTMNWALLSDVSVETDTRLKERLEASQRSIDLGHQVLSIERGLYELTSHRHRSSGDAQTADPREVTIVLGQAGHSEMFDEMVGVLARSAAESFEGSDVLAEAEKAGPSELLFVARVPRLAPAADSGASTPKTEPGKAGWSDFLIVSGARSDPAGSELRARVVFRDQSRRGANLLVPLSSDASFRALSQDSLLTIVQSAPVQQVLGLKDSSLDFLRELSQTLPDALGPLMATRQALSLRRIDAASGTSGVSAEGPRCAAVLALETTSTGELARALDGSIARFVHSLEQGSGLQQPTPQDFLGQLPQVPRVLPARMGNGSLLRLLSSDPIAFAWSYPTVEGLNPGESPGWWVMTVAPVPEGHDALPGTVHRGAVAALSTPDSTPGMRRWIWLGSARPAEVEALLPQIIPDFLGLRTATKRIEAAGIELSVSESGDIQGDLTLRLAEPKP